MYAHINPREAHGLILRPAPTGKSTTAGKYGLGPGARWKRRVQMKPGARPKISSGYVPLVAAAESTTEAPAVQPPKTGSLAVSGACRHQSIRRYNAPAMSDIVPQVRLHNSLTRRTEVLEPLEPGRVAVYTCGSTVYKYAHIGNLRTYLFGDLLHRTLEYVGYEVRYVKNITDVGHMRDDQLDSLTGPDKIELAAQTEGKSPWRSPTSIRELGSMTKRSSTSCPPMSRRRPPITSPR